MAENRKQYEKYESKYVYKLILANAKYVSINRLWTLR